MHPLNPADTAEFALLTMILLAVEAKSITTDQAIKLTGHDAALLSEFRAAAIDGVMERWQKLNPTTGA
jgi:hypothetical protein